ncbi:MAG: carboxypeptidase regulatory-like domain-containing protein [Candidatus Acidiferrum sp.]
MVGRKPSVAVILSALLAGLCLANAFAAPQQAASPVRIEVTEPAGAGVAHVPIRLVPAPDPAPAKMQTDENGELSLNLAPGGYALYVDFPGFKPLDKFINVQDTKDVQIIPVRLEMVAMGSPTVYPDPATPPATSKDDLRISAHPYHEDMILTVADLKAMPQTTVKVHNEHTKADETYTGVRVADLLTKMDAPLGNKLRGAALSDYLVATGSDGYVAVIALAEADPSFHSGEVIVADTMDGQPLDAHSGPFKLVVTEDKRPARWVRDLVTLELKSAK